MCVCACACVCVWGGGLISALKHVMGGLHLVGPASVCAYVCVRTLYAMYIQVANTSSASITTVGTKYEAMVSATACNRTVRTPSHNQLSQEALCSWPGYLITHR